VQSWTVVLTVLCPLQKRQEGRLRGQLQEVRAKRQPGSAGRFPPVGGAQPPPLGGGFKLAPIAAPSGT